MEEHCLAGQHALIGCDNDLPVGIECSGLVVTFNLGRSYNYYLSLRAAKRRFSKLANAGIDLVRPLVTSSVTEDISSTPGKIAFLQEFSTVFRRIRESQGKIEIDASRRKITVSASRQDIDTLLDESRCLEENVDPLPPIYREIAVKHFANVRHLFKDKLTKVRCLSKSQVILFQSSEGGVEYFSLVATSKQFIQDALPLLESLFASRTVVLEDIHNSVTCSDEWTKLLESLPQDYRVCVVQENETVLKIMGVKVDLDPCYIKVHRVLDSCATVKPVVFENCEDIDIVWQELGLIST